MCGFQSFNIYQQLCTFAICIKIYFALKEYQRYGSQLSLPFADDSLFKVKLKKIDQKKKTRFKKSTRKSGGTKPKLITVAGMNSFPRFAKKGSIEIRCIRNSPKKLSFWRKMHLLTVCQHGVDIVVVKLLFNTVHTFSLQCPKKHKY